MQLSNYNCYKYVNFIFDDIFVLKTNIWEKHC